ncbi:hypothetical protein [Brevifollis gellanilyticus]|uniref:Uncharacterized protein n=1 Tax=Brevifollis gellanilyticus TaxID=748831 RepID=A0A512MGP3_9BACT|nr:hypothetical protein [Brevifollis gellanilyticus]GEP45898.1 hypothetical protein BGE01nite_51890 [Brevifollis gellanilyticus]
MQKAFQRISKGYRERPGTSVLYGFLISIVVAFALAVMGPFLPDSTPGESTDTESILGIGFTVCVFVLSGLWGCWFAAEK